MQYEINHANLEDLEQIILIEQSLFEEGVADTYEVMRQRIERGRESFLVARNVNGEIIAYVAASALAQRYLTDNLFEDVAENVLHPYSLVICGLAVKNSYQKQGIAHMLLHSLEDKARQLGASVVSLTCLPHLIKFYERHGYCNEGLSASNHGGKEWYNMVKEL